MYTTSSKKNGPWFLLWFPPILFFLVIAAFSIYFGFEAQGNAAVIAEKTAGATPYILLTVQLLLLGLQFILFHRQGISMHDLGWRVGASQAAWKELVLGAVIGAPLGILWIYVIEPILSTVQTSVGDYVPAGSLFPALGGAIIPFAIADVLLAPFVEENIYRGYGMTELLSRFGGAVQCWFRAFSLGCCTGPVAFGTFSRQLSLSAFRWQFCVCDAAIFSSLLRHACP